MPTDCLFREDSYLKECSATVVGLTETGGVVLDRTVFYAVSGGQPSDGGVLTTSGGDAILIANATFTDPGKTEIAHQPAVAAGINLRLGDPVHALIDWDRRYARMRMHSALHLLSAALPFPVVQVGPFVSVPVRLATVSRTVVPVPSSSFHWLTRTFAVRTVCWVPTTAMAARHTATFTRRLPRLFA